RTGTGSPASSSALNGRSSGGPSRNMRATRQPPPDCCAGPTDGCARPRRRDRVIDCHVHLAALRTEENGCYISPRMLRSPLIKFLAWKHGLSLDDARRSNQKYVDDLLAELGKAQYVEKAVLLGLEDRK